MNHIIAMISHVSGGMIGCKLIANAAEFQTKTELFLINHDFAINILANIDTSNSVASTREHPALFLAPFTPF